MLCYIDYGLLHFRAAAAPGTPMCYSCGILFKIHGILLYYFTGTCLNVNIVGLNTIIGNVNTSGCGFSIQDSSKGGAVETGCRCLYDVTY